MNEVNEILLSKFIAGEATPEEAILVNDWIESSEENKIDFAQLERTWALGKITNKQRLSPTTSGITLLQSTNQTSPSRQIFLPLSKIAAAVFLILSVSGILYYHSLQRPAPEALWETKRTL